MVKEAGSKKGIRRMALVVSAAVALSLVCAALWKGQGRENTVFLIILGAAFVFLVYAEKLSLTADESVLEKGLRWTALPAILLQVVFLTRDYALVSLLVGGAMALAAVILCRLTRKRWLSLAAAVGLAFVTLIVVEALLRHYRPLEAGQAGEIAALERHPTRTFALKPNRRTHLKWNYYDYWTDTNSYGLNSPEINAVRPEPETLRIMVVGDGVTMPNGLGYAEAYPMQLEGMLRRQLNPGSVQVINAGVTGYGPAEISAQLKELAPVFTPDLVIYQFSPSEFKEVLLTPQERLRSYGLIPRYDSARVRMLKSLQLIARYEQVSRKLSAVIRGKSSDRLHRGLIERYYTSAGNGTYRPEVLKKIACYLARMKEVCTAAGSRLLICYVPEVTEVMRLTGEALAGRDQELFDGSQDSPCGEREVSDSRKKEDLKALNLPFHYAHRIAAGRGLDFCDITPFLVSRRKGPLYIKKSRHWTAEGHRTAAGGILHILRRRGYLR